ncbi:MAG: 30S ribosomal protein THX [Bacteroidia bacterium]
MGKGDKKSRKGKIAMGSYGVSRPRKASTGNAFVPKSSKKSTPRAEKTETVEAPKAAAKKTTVKKAVVAKAPAAEKTVAKKAPAKKAAKKEE